MKLTHHNKQLRRRQLDRLLSTPTKPANLPYFKRGYIREIRDCLGITSTQLASMLKVSQPAVAGLEKSEIEGTISLNTLRKVAQALDCQLVFSLVPNSSLEQNLASRAKKVATRILKKRTAGKNDGKQIDELATQLMRDLDKRLWEPDSE